MNGQYTVTIPAAAGGIDGVVVWPAHQASVFHVVTSTAPFGFRPDNGHQLTVSDGKGMGYPGGPKWTKVTLYNSTANPITATFWLGSDAFSDNAVTSTNITVTSVQDGSTYTKATDAPALAAAAVLTFNGLDGIKIRKQIVVANNDPATALQILDNGNTRGGLVQPKTSWTLATNGVVKVKNPSGGAMDVCVVETFYS
jgi:hypothetical protein